MMSEKLLFTPGPLTTSPSVKSAMLSDLGSRDETFIQIVQQIRTDLLDLAGLGDAPFEAIPLQGSGTYGIEAVLSSVTPPDGRWLIIVNGAYGRRMCQILDIHNIPYIPLLLEEDQAPHPSDVEDLLRREPSLSHIAIVHCETTTGLINPLQETGALAHAYQKIFFVDAMSSFGALPIDFHNAHIDYLVSSANKCIQGLPGFSFVLARRSCLLHTRGHARTLSLDLLAQWEGLEKNGQFRFTPPIQALLAFAQALTELKEEGGVKARHARYQKLHTKLSEGMRQLGFTPYLPQDKQSPIITTFHYPHPTFNFDAFYALLSQKGFVIYPGKLTQENCFRIGTIGNITLQDIDALLAAIQLALSKL